jgi:4-diphosphocytidyl-2-C-methyl-D-erythritol kinase
MLFFPNAKINIGLNILRKRNDGYHDIETIFCPTALADILEFVQIPDEQPGKCQYSATGIAVDGDPETNLCVKAYRLLCKDFNLPAIQVHLHKIIPPGAGLGGGSSDGAFMLKYLDKEFELGLGEDQLCAYASQLGSDCAFFILNRPVFGFERGNRFREIGNLPEELELALVNPGIHVSTGEAYGAITPRVPGQSLEQLVTEPIEQWKDRIVNDFEQPISARYPVIGQIRDQLYNMGATYASMSGSGSTVYGIFRQKAPNLQEHFPKCFCWSGPAMPLAV